MKKFFCLALSVLLTAVTLCAAAAPAETELTRFTDELTRQQTQTGFLTSWQAADQAALAGLINQYGLYTGDPVSVSQYQYPDPGTMIQNAFVSVYGEAAFWPLALQARFEALLVTLALQEKTYHVLPAPGELSLEDVLLIARNAVELHAQEYGYTTAELDSCRVSAQCVRYDGDDAPLFLVDYYLPDRLQILFSMTIQQNGACSFSYQDPLAMRNVYRDWVFERNFTRFIRWELADKQAFWAVLNELYDHETERYGALPPIGETVLAHVQSLPEANELQPDRAEALALQALRAQGADPAAYTPTLSFYRDDAAPPRYEIAWVDGDDQVQYAVAVDALTGDCAIQPAD